MRLRLFLGACAALVLGIGASAASASAAGQATCSGGVIAPGTYDGLTVTGTCTINGTVTINGNVRVADGAYLDAAYSSTRLTINGNATVGNRGKLGLGCTYGYHDCGLNPTWLGNVTVNGNVVGSNALTMYLDFTTIRGNVVVNGGGDITLVDHPPLQDGLVLPIKDNVIGGNLVVQGWKGAWFGIIRDTVGGSVLALNTAGTRLGDQNALDSTEIVTNKISGNLICLGNSPPAQIGDSGGSPNQVGGVKIGECASL